jgi:hypothetical protein
MRWARGTGWTFGGRSHEGLGCAFGICLALASVRPASAQSLFLDRGQNGVSFVAGWSVGPSSNGVETETAVGLDGRLDVGLGISRTPTTLATDSSRRSTKLPRSFGHRLKEPQGSPVSVAECAAFRGFHSAEQDTGRYVQAGMTAFKALKLGDRVDLSPSSGSFWSPSPASFAGDPPERATYPHGRSIQSDDGARRRSRDAVAGDARGTELPAGDVSRPARGDRAAVLVPPFSR